MIFPPVPAAWQAVPLLGGALQITVPPTVDSSSTSFMLPNWSSQRSVAEQEVWIVSVCVPTGPCTSNLVLTSETRSWSPGNINESPKPAVSTSESAPFSHARSDSASCVA